MTNGDFERLCHEATEYVYRLTAHNDQHIRVYLASEDLMAWELFATRKKRSWESVALPKALKEELVDDVKRFLASKSVYEELGVPFKRNYLLLGSPGSGKSTAVSMLASALGMNLCYLNFSGQMDNQRLCRLMSEIKKDSICVIEDIDSAGVGQESKDQNVSAVTYSCLLNILDGPFHVEDLILIMTANSLDKLGAAFKRVARIDRTFVFGALEEPEMKQMFEKILPEPCHRQWEAFFEKVRYIGSDLTAGILQEFLVDLRLQHPDGKVDVTKRVSQLKKLIKSVERTKTEIEKVMYGEM
jgi:chaperone BCS1